MNSKPVHVSLAGGLGNQLFQISAALKLTAGEVFLHDFLNNARRNQNGDLEFTDFRFPDRVKLVPSRPITRIERKFINFLYGIGAGIHSRKISILKSVALQLAPMVFRRILKTRVRVLVAVNLGDFKFKFPDNEIVLVGYFQSWDWSQSLADWARSGDFQLATEKIEFPISRKSENDFVVCLHIRRGDYKNEQSIGLLNKDYFNSALRIVLADRTEAEIWLFSDDTLDIHELIDSDFLPMIRVVPTASTCLTFQLMRSANAYVLSNSTFSWWAARASYTAKPLVVLPDPWFKELAPPAGIIPESWHALSSTFS